MRAKTAIFTLSVIADIIRLKNISIKRIRQSWEQEVVGACEVMMESPDFEEIPEGARFPEATITIHTKYCEHCGQHYVEKSEVS